MPESSDDMTLPVGNPPASPTMPEPDTGNNTLNRVTADGTGRTERIEPGALPEIPGYLVEAELGRGGMGVVYKARQTTLSRTVALKMVLAGTHARTEDLIRFLAEAETAARLQHQGIVQIYDSGRHDGLPYFTMEFVDGGSLADRLANGPPLEPKEAARIALALTEAVATAHAAGVIHRDLKPGNILLTNDGTPKITDFGLARRLEAGDGITKTGAILGTPAYMPPEQAKGDVHNVGPAGDTYSLGAILYEMLTGRPPFRSENPMQTLSLVLNTMPASVRSQNRSVPRDLETIALKCLEKDPARRYASAEALATDLRRFLEGRAILARRVNQLERLQRWAKRNPAVASLLVAVLVLLTTGTIVSTALAIRAAASAQQARAEKERADETAKELAKKAKEAEEAHRDAMREAGEARTARGALAHTLADSYVTLGLTAADQNQPGIASLWYAQALGQSVGDPERELENRIRVQSGLMSAFVPEWTMKISNRQLQRLTFHPGGRYLLGRGSGFWYELWDLDRDATWTHPEGFQTVLAAAWDPSGTLVALGSSGKAGVFKFPSGEAVQTWDRSEATTAVNFNADGTQLALGGKTVQVWDLKDKKFVTPELVHFGTVHWLEFSPDGALLASAAIDARARIFDLSAMNPAKPTLTAVHRPEFYNSPRLVPVRFLDNGRTVLTLPTSAIVAGHDTQTGDEKFRTPVGNGLLDLAVSPDGLTFWTAGYTTLGLGDKNGLLKTSPVPFRNNITSLVPLPDGSGVIAGSRERVVRVVNRLGSGLLLPPLPHTASVWAVGCSVDGKRMATFQEDGLLRVWVMPPGPPARDLVTGKGYILARLAHGGRLVLPTGGSAGNAAVTQIQLYDTITGAPGRHQFEPGGVLLDADLSPNGRVLVTASSTAYTWTARDKVMHTSEGGLIRFWDVGTGEPIGEPIPMPTEPRSVRFRPDGNEAAVVCSVGQVLFLNPKDGSVRQRGNAWRVPEVAGHYVNNGAGEYSRDGRTLYAFGAGAGGAVALDPATGAPKFTVAGGKSFGMCESADARFVAFAGMGRSGTGVNGMVSVVDAQTGNLAAPILPHPDWAFTAKFNSDGTRLLTACRDNSARLWDWKAGKQLAVFTHTDEVMAADLTPDGRFVVTVSADGTARVWLAATGRQVTPPVQLGGRGLTLDITPDGRYAVVGGFMLGLKVIDLHALTRPDERSTESIKQFAELLAGARIDANGGIVNFTGDEWLARFRDYQRQKPRTTSP